MAMPMLRSATRIALRQLRPASSFFGNVGRRSPASSITSRRNYFEGNPYNFRKEDIPEWDGMGFFIGSFSLAVGFLFYHKLRTSRYNTAYYEKKSTTDVGHYGQEKVEKKELFEASMSESD